MAKGKEKGKAKGNPKRSAKGDAKGKAKGKSAPWCGEDQWWSAKGDAEGKAKHKSSSWCGECYLTREAEDLFLSPRTKPDLVIRVIILMSQGIAIDQLLSLVAEQGDSSAMWTEEILEGLEFLKERGTTQRRLEDDPSLRSCIEPQEGLLRYLKGSLPIIFPKELRRKGAADPRFFLCAICGLPRKIEALTAESRCRRLEFESLLCIECEGKGSEESRVLAKALTQVNDFEKLRSESIKRGLDQREAVSEYLRSKQKIVTPSTEGCRLDELSDHEGPNFFLASEETKEAKDRKLERGGTHGPEGGQASGRRAQRLARMKNQLMELPGRLRPGKICSHFDTPFSLFTSYFATRLGSGDGLDTNGPPGIGKTRCTGAIISAILSRKAREGQAAKGVLLTTLTLAADNGTQTTLADQYELGLEDVGVTHRTGRKDKRDPNQTKIGGGNLLITTAGSLLSDAVRQAVEEASILATSELHDAQLLMHFALDKAILKGIPVIMDSATTPPLIVSNVASRIKLSQATLTDAFFELEELKDLEDLPPSTSHSRPTEIREEVRRTVGSIFPGGKAHPKYGSKALWFIQGWTRYIMITDVLSQMPEYSHIVFVYICRNSPEKCKAYLYSDVKELTIVLTTNVCQVAITPKVDIVVDDGREAQTTTSGELRFNQLITLNGAQQRLGRTGRTRKGLVIRRYREESLKALSGLEATTIQDTLEYLLLKGSGRRLNQSTAEPFTYPRPYFVRTWLTLLKRLGLVELDSSAIKR